MRLHCLHERFCAATRDSHSVRCSFFFQKVSQRFRDVSFDSDAFDNLDVDIVRVLCLEQPASCLPACGTKTRVSLTNRSHCSHSSRKDSTERFVLTDLSRWENCQCDSNSMCGPDSVTRLTSSSTWSSLLRFGLNLLAKCLDCLT